MSGPTKNTEHSLNRSPVHCVLYTYLIKITQKVHKVIKEFAQNLKMCTLCTFYLNLAIFDEKSTDCVLLHFERVL